MRCKYLLARYLYNQSTTPTPLFSHKRSLINLPEAQATHAHAYKTPEILLDYNHVHGLQAADSSDLTFCVYKIFHLTVRRLLMFSGD